MSFTRNARNALWIRLELNRKMTRYFMYDNYMWGKLQSPSKVWQQEVDFGRDDHQKTTWHEQTVTLINYLEIFPLFKFLMKTPQGIDFDVWNWRNFSRTFEVTKIFSKCNGEELKKSTNNKHKKISMHKIFEFFHLYLLSKKINFA